MYQIQISVRGLVEFIFRTGDIASGDGSFSKNAMLEGSRIHRKIQGKMGLNYEAEVPLSITIEQPDYELTIEGRADGILTEEDGVTIDEIKGVYKKLDHMECPVFVHQAQAMCYAYIFALQHGIEHIGIQMTYVNLDTEEIKYFHEDFTFAALEEWFDELIRAYKKWSDFQYAWRILRQESIQKLQFPFPYRKGQKELAAGVYRTIIFA